MIRWTVDGGRWTVDGRHRGGRRVALPSTAYCLLLAVLCLPASGCGYYSFTGASIPEHVRTVAIPLVEDRSPGGVPSMDQVLTDLLVERFVRQTRLALEPDENAADALLTATIERYQNQPTAVTGDEVAALNRVTITVRVVYRDQVEDEERLARSFSSYAEYDAANISAEEATATAVLEQIADDIFTAATSDW